MMLSTAMLLFSLLVALVFAQDTSSVPPNAGISIINPLIGSVAHTGTILDIRWNVVDTTATTIEAISLMNGSATNLNFAIPNILTNGPIPVSDLSYSWTIPCNLSTSQDYAISARGANSYMTYSTYFTIVSNATNCVAAI